ncbi:trypsin-like peptidase domain-containing protein [Nonomuraea sp. K274]|uniref:Trypsin-like peptidase domain-containing protein n=1 Tax=Nonomuraea cypriaca TaxID=1187855 RepID=A0A931AHG9_9ACTN|nr:trypsin-like peptidase domain-containing protein [Nonomuraea cypriaca]MBF8190563.1 trypsin-like peptidase domain-containing protein [Nonomuraea cypriaca]
MNANEPREQHAGGWSQFGSTPPAAGGFPQRDTIAMEQQPPPPPPPAPPKRTGLSGAGRKAVAGLALAAMAVGGGIVGAVVANSFQPEPVASGAPSPTFRSASNQLTVAEVAAKVQPSVVMIQGQTGEGSGVVLSEDGLILTNNHVVEGASQGGQMTVKFSDGKTAKATVVGTDPATDLAVIRADGVSGLTEATLGDSDALKVGDAVLAIGSPLGLDGSVTAGIVSALDRTLTTGDEPRQQLPPGWGQEPQSQGASTTIGGAIQTDASINPGNSGGALVNAAGELVGINTAIASEAAGGGVGFAIPVNTARHVSEQLIDNGKVSHAYLGVSVTDATGDVPGALVREITPGSPAEKAGMRQGDLITEIGGKAVDGGDTVVGQVRGFKPGQQVKITYMRDGAEAEVTVTLEEMK